MRNDRVVQCKREDKSKAKAHDAAASPVTVPSAWHPMACTEHLQGALHEHPPRRQLRSLIPLNKAGCLGWDGIALLCST